MSKLKRTEILSINHRGWNEVASQFYGGTALPRYGPLAATEENLHLIPDLAQERVLELGCGSGHTLAYLWERKNASELWGLDFSEQQIRFTGELLAEKEIPARLFLSSMDENPGIPNDYFDLVVAIYSLGWTPDLEGTLELIYSYLKPGGIFIFSWEHPAYRSLRYEVNLGKYVFQDSYLEEGPMLYRSWRGVQIVINHRKLSTYLNAMAKSGLLFEQLIESKPNLALASEEDDDPEKWYSIPRAQFLPTTFIVKAHKPS
jgi:SAM-dependent methyltransferase